MQSTHESKTPAKTTSSNPKKTMAIDTLIKKMDSDTFSDNCASQLSWEAFEHNDSHLAAIARTTNSTDTCMSAVIAMMFAKKPSISFDEIKNYFTPPIADEKSAYNGHCALSLGAMNANGFLVKIIERFKNFANRKEIFKLLSNYRIKDSKGEQHSLYTLAIKYGCEANINALHQIDPTMASFRKKEHYKIAQAGHLEMAVTKGINDKRTLRCLAVVLDLAPKSTNINTLTITLEKFADNKRKENKKRKLDAQIESKEEQDSKEFKRIADEPASKRLKPETAANSNENAAKNLAPLQIDTDNDSMDLSGDKGSSSNGKDEKVDSTKTLAVDDYVLALDSAIAELERLKKADKSQCILAVETLTHIVDRIKKQSAGINHPTTSPSMQDQLSVTLPVATNAAQGTSPSPTILGLPTEQKNAASPSKNTAVEATYPSAQVSPQQSKNFTAEPTKTPLVKPKARSPFGDINANWNSNPRTSPTAPPFGCANPRLLGASPKFSNARILSHLQNKELSPPMLPTSNSSSPSPHNAGGIKPSTSFSLSLTPRLASPSSNLAFGLLGHLGLERPTTPNKPHVKAKV